MIPENSNAYSVEAFNERKLHHSLQGSNTLTIRIKPSTARLREVIRAGVMLDHNSPPVSFTATAVGRGETCSIVFTCQKDYAKTVQKGKSGS